MQSKALLTSQKTPPTVCLLFSADIISCNSVLNAVCSVLQSDENETWGENTG